MFNFAYILIETKKNYKMKKLNITVEDEFSFSELEDEFVKSLTVQQVQEMNDSIEKYKAEFYKGKLERNKNIFHVCVMTLSFLFFWFNFGLFFAFPIIGGIAIFVYRLYLTCKKINFADIMVGNLEHSKQEYLKRR